MPSSPTETDYHRLHDFRYSIRRFLRFSEDAARQAGLEPQQHQLLLAIKARGDDEGLGVGDVAERLQVRHHSAVELIDRAEARGLVDRRQADGDRRHVLVRLTDAGEEMIARLAAVHLEELRTAAPDLLRVLTNVVGFVPTAAGNGAAHE